MALSLWLVDAEYVRMMRSNQAASPVQISAFHDQNPGVRRSRPRFNFASPEELGEFIKETCE